MIIPVPTLDYLRGEHGFLLVKVSERGTSVQVLSWRIYQTLTEAIAAAEELNKIATKNR